MNIKNTYTFIIISACSFILLCAVQFHLVYNTYELKNKSYYYSERELIKDQYTKLIHKDLLYPGGKAIIDTVLNENWIELFRLYKMNSPMYDAYKKAVMDTLFYRLKQHECLQDFFYRYRKDFNNKDSIIYALALSSLKLNIDNKKSLTLYEKKDLDENEHIGGDLANQRKSNMVVSFFVESENRLCNYQISFLLFADTTDRFWNIMKEMIPMFCISIGSVLIIILLFFNAFRKWQSQKKLSEMKTDFINNITHEFNTPLSAIIVANKGLHNDKIIENKDNIRSVSAIIDRQSRRLEQLVNQVLEVVSYSRITLHCEMHSLHKILNEIISDFETRLDSISVVTRLQLTVSNDTIMLDQFYFTTLIVNILDNAVKYNNSDTKWINIAVTEKDQGLQLCISDNGLGMSDETQKYAFTKFYRSTDNVQTIHSKGMGLGLYYAHEIIKAHGWQIKIESQLGEGAMFVILIPNLAI